MRSRGVSNRVYPYQGRFRLHVPKEVAEETITRTSGVLTAIDERSCRFESGSHSLAEMIVWVAVLGFDFDIEGPAELIEHARAIGARLTRAGAR